MKSLISKRSWVFVTCCCHCKMKHWRRRTKLLARNHKMAADIFTKALMLHLLFYRSFVIREFLTSFCLIFIIKCPPIISLFWIKLQHSILSHWICTTFYLLHNGPGEVSDSISSCSKRWVILGSLQGCYKLKLFVLFLS